MEIWIAPILTGVLVGIVLIGGNRIFTRLDKIDAEISAIRREHGERLASLEGQFKMFSDWFKPDHQKRIGE